MRRRKRRGRGRRWDQAWGLLKVGEVTPKTLRHRIRASRPGCAALATGGALVLEDVHNTVSYPTLRHAGPPSPVVAAFANRLAWPIQSWLTIRPLEIPVMSATRSVVSAAKS